MSDENQTNQVDELTLLKQQADKLGIDYRDNIGLDTLKKRIASVIEPEDNDDDVAEMTHQQLRAKLVSDARRLVRVRISCMDPVRSELQGEIFTIANSFIGTISKFIPYGAAGENGYHIEKALLDNLRLKTFSEATTERDEKGRPFVTRRTRKFFNIEVLPSLTKEELEKLATDQRAAGRV